MAVAFDVSAGAVVVTGASSGSFSISASGSDRAAIVGVAWFGAPTVSSVTYNGVSATAVASRFENGGNFVQLFALAGIPTGSQTVQVTFSGAIDEGAIACCTFTGVDQSTPVGAAFTASGPNCSAVVSDAVSGDMCVDALKWYITTPTVGAGQSLRAQYGTGEALSMSTEAATGSTTMSWTNLSDSALMAVAVKQAASTSLEQEGFRWGVDDGNEAAHTWEAGQDTDISIADTQSRLIRGLVNATGDPSATAYTLRYQKNGSGGYVAVPVGSGTSPTLSYGTAGTIDYSANGGTSVAPAYPTGITTNSCLVLVVGQKPSSANGGTVTTPSGWTLQGSLTGANDGDTGGYTTTLGADTGNTNIFVYTKDTVAGTETGTLSVTVGTNNVCWANIYRIQASTTCTWSYACGTGKDTSGGNVSIATGGMDITAGDHIIAGMVIPTDVTTPAQFTSEALAQTSTTFATVNEIEEPDSGTGNDIGGFLCEAGVSSGGASGAVTLTATAGGTTTNVRGPGFVFRARATGITNEVYVVTSSNIAASGEATTARLTAPAGKTTSDFVTGRRWGDENGTDTIDITADDYTEVEWLVFIAATANPADYYDFRVYAGSSALNTYTVTPRWTIAGGVVASFVFQRSIAPLLLH